MRAEVEHPPVAHQDDLGKPEAAAQLLDLGLERGRVGGVAGKGLDRDRAADLVGEQAEDDLAAVRAVVARVAEGGERAVGPFHVRARQVVEDERARGEMAPREGPLDPRLASEQPVERAVELVLRRVGDVQDRPQRALPKRAGGGELGAGGEEAGPDHGQREIPRVAPPPLQERLEAETPEHAEDGRHVAVGDAAYDPEGRLRRDEPFPPQAPLDRVDDRRRQRGERGEGPVLDLPSNPVRLAEQDRGVFAAPLHVSHSGHVHCPARSPRHAPIIAHPAPDVKPYSGYISKPSPGHTSARTAWEPCSGRASRRVEVRVRQPVSPVARRGPGGGQPAPGRTGDGVGRTSGSVGTAGWSMFVDCSASCSG